MSYNKTAQTFVMGHQTGIVTAQLKVGSGITVKSLSTTSALVQIGPHGSSLSLGFLLPLGGNFSPSLQSPPANLLGLNKGRSCIVALPWRVLVGDDAFRVVTGVR